MADLLPVSLKLYFIIAPVFHDCNENMKKIVNHTIAKDIHLIGICINQELHFPSLNTCARSAKDNVGLEKSKSKAKELYRNV